MDDRKNLEGLLAGWAATSASVRERWQLAIACRASPLERNHYELRAQHHGVGDSVVLTGYVPDDVLLALTQAADLAVFPSLYEGFGLPVVEALACATPVVAANTSCLPELLDPVALFDPLDPHAIARAITRGLTDESYRAELTHASARPISSWDDVADRMAAGYHEVVARPAPAPDRTRPRVAVVAPFPPQRTGVAEWAWLLVDELRELCDVDALADGFHLDHSPPAVPDSVETHPARSLRFVEAARNGYDTVLYNVGNSEFHAGALAELQRRPGTVLAHEVRLVDLFALSADQRGAVPDGFAATVERLYPGVAPPELRGAGRIPHDVAERLGLFMLREIAAHSEQVLVTSEFAAGIARIDAGPDLEDRIGVMPFAIFPPNGGVAPEPPRDAAPVVASFGLVHAVKQPDVLVDAFALVRDSVPAARLAFVGRCSDEQAAAVRAAAQRAGVADAVELTGAVDMEEYAAWLARAAVAVQLRSSSNGESSGAVGNCLSFGVPTIVSAVGPNRELPDSAVRRVPAGVHAPALASAITELLYDDATRRALRAGALRYAAEHTHAVVARWLYDHVIVPATFRYVNQ